MADHKIPRRIVIRPLPKIVFLYPTLIWSIVCALLALWWGTEWTVASPQVDQAAVESVVPAESGAAEAAAPVVETIKLPPLWAANVWMIVFMLNMIIFAFEFPRTRGLMILFAVVAAILAMVHFEIIAPLSDLLSQMRPYADSQFYTTISIFLAIIGLMIAIHTRFNYYEIEGNSILHHTGFMGRTKRYPTPNLRRSMEITDVFEYALLGSGQYIFYPSQEREAIVLEVVPGIVRKDKQIELMMGVMKMDSIEDDDLEDTH